MKRNIPISTASLLIAVGPSRGPGRCNNPNDPYPRPPIAGLGVQRPVAGRCPKPGPAARSPDTEYVMRLTVLTAVTGLLVLVFIFELLRRRQLREKYAVLWLSVGIVIVPLGLFPRLLDGIASSVGVAYGISLVLFLGIVFLLLVCIHLSWEASRLEEETRTLAEEVALIKTEMSKREHSND
ncbi:DUF2304 domain-containing protein [Yinghuangia soli]|uniref:DUF2304 domain-containing protein n=1 Tax=Yinghuangia soli TaxID=2908204 RepID=A0AA41TXG8_9ACTN|nr:DUF2304 domain-containing protein [Yinghuangia soli]MCF2526828.1 DUF2304 domain-containing protein [Yinghuangia soli]